MRYIARRFDTTGALYPADADASLEVEEVLGLSDDIARDWVPALYMGMGDRHTKYGHPAEFAQKADTVKAMREKFVAEDLPKWMGFLGSKLDKNGAFLAGPNVTIADLQVLSQLRYFTKGVADHVPKDCLEAYPKITAWMAKMHAVPEIKKWYNL